MDNFDGTENSLKRYHYTRIDRTSHELSSDIIYVEGIFDHLVKRGFIFTKNDVSYELITEFGNNEYLCTGSCYCEDDDFDFRRNALLSRSLNFLVGSISSVVAFKYAEDYFQEECEKSFTDSDFRCSESRIRSNVENCEELGEHKPYVESALRDKRQLKLWTDDIEDFELEKEDFTPEQIVFTDGCCHHNGQENARAGVGVFFGEEDVRNIARRLEGKQTNNRAELSAIMDALIHSDDGVDLEIRSDSQYSIKVAKGEWRAHTNTDLVYKIRGIILKRKGKVKFTWVKGHTGEEDGNYWADLLAGQGAEKELTS